MPSFSSRFSWRLPSFNENHTFPLSRSSTASSSSWRYRRPSFQHEEPQIIAGSYIDRASLVDLLNRRFGREYDLKVRSDGYKLYASRKLTEDEIMGCVY
ncbi:hypothetical protein B0H67DRAFT_572850 [Lasiosphaeris hirsuta]|uniref:Uncharacterized protein n=1 Tax=Lasiosphaeris hirsuta TaxID=260670 RepID=A0AA40DWU2_9PEZI|nr:hypothetical protein B0H67DRAFT_572850 [Lasiosphaeris hirsuta]